MHQHRIRNQAHVFKRLIGVNATRLFGYDVKASVDSILFIDLGVTQKVDYHSLADTLHEKCSTE